MTTTPATIGVDQTIAAADALMAKHQIRHLPVLSGGALVGILSDRDVAIIKGLRDVDAQRVKVEEAMSAQPYTVEPEAPINEVAGEMARHKYGAVIVQQNRQVVGVLTTVDICRVLSELFEERLR
ncbi:MAG: CBS domain-containing protein [Archangiaceae bacterium]|nr:CBS domain-containing protein [Archangiaceae bacterium]